jgi:hypothetical protein
MMKKTPKKGYLKIQPLKKLKGIQIEKIDRKLHFYMHLGQCIRYKYLKLYH